MSRERRPTSAATRKWCCASRATASTGSCKFESGGHRVQRVPATETQGRIHTSACTVAVMPEPDEAEEVHAQPGRAAHRHLPRQRRRRPARQQDRQRDPHHPPAHRHRGRVPGRPLAAPQQGQGDGGAGGAAARQGAQRARRQGGRHAQEPDRQRRPQRPHPHLQLPAGPADRPPHQPDAVQAAADHGRRPRRRDRRAAGRARRRAAGRAGKRRA